MIRFKEIFEIIFEFSSERVLPMLAMYLGREWTLPDAFDFSLASHLELREVDSSGLDDASDDSIGMQVCTSSGGSLLSR